MTYSDLTDLVPSYIAAQQRTISLADAAAAMQALLASSGDLTDETRLVAETSYTFPGVGAYAYALPDYVIDTDGRVRLVECNTSNAGGGSVFGRDLPRVAHECDVMLARGVSLTEDAVFLTPTSPDSRSLPEIHTRAAIRARLLESLLGRPAALASAAVAVLPPGPVAVYGPIPTIANDLVLDATGLRYRGRPVAFMNNPNLLVELARRQETGAEELIASLANHRAQPDPLHEGAKIALLGLDKMAQQIIAARSGSTTPVSATMTTGDIGDIVAQALEMARRHGGAIIKPMAASGGTGVIPVDESMSESDLICEVRTATEKLRSKYGDAWATTSPLGVFEFIDIQPAMTPTGPRRWDLRLQVLASPERTIITPLSARLCPTPIGGPLCRSNAVNNMTGRSTADVNRVDVRELVARVGSTEHLLERFAVAAYDFVRTAVAAVPAFPARAL